MSTAPPGSTGPAAHWDAAYRNRAVEDVSWYEADPSTSLQLVDALDVPGDAPMIDVGGGASYLADRLLERGFSDVTVLDISEAALEQARWRLGSRVDWVRADLRAWRPARRYRLWHDRAVLHFLVDERDREAYLRALHAALPTGDVILATFAPTGPERCSGLPVSRYAATDLAALLGPRFELLHTRDETHVTPAGQPQRFTWVAGRMHPSSD